MLEFFRNLFNTDDFPPRWHCGNWEEGHGWLHIISDTLIFGAYVSIPAALVFFTWRKYRELLSQKIVILFAIFILSCGIGHLIEASIFWNPWYRFSGVVKAITAIVSWITVFALIKHMPLALKMPGLAKANQELETSLTANQVAHEKLKQSNHDLDQFAYVASHDLKAPLRSINNLATWVVEDCEEILPDASKTHLRQLQDRVSRLDNLLEDLLTYSRSGSDQLEPEAVEIDLVVKDQFWEIAGVESGFKLEIPEPLPTIQTWRIPCEQILRNLISNAIKHHGSTSGTITILSEPYPEGHTITVKDDGVGIPEEFHESIFGMFQTLNSRDVTEGSGMGLAIVTKLVQRIGGRIELDSSAGNGAEFTLHIPSQTL